MEKYTDVVITHTKLPTYLVELLQTEEEIILVHCKKKVEEVSFWTTEISVDSTLNLTGSPLEVDLNVLPSAAATHLPISYNSDEAKHIPMKFKSARKFVNDYNKINSGELGRKPISIYCVCDGTDEKNIVVLGSYQVGGCIVRTLVFIGDCVDETHPENNLNSMVNEHIQNVGIDTPKIETRVTCLYELYGYNLSNNCVLENLENTGSVLVEGSWNSLEYNIPQYGATIKMMLQVIIGHENSIMSPFFQELAFLQHCSNTLNKKLDTLDDFVVSCSPLDTADLRKKISDILNEVSVVREPSVEPSNIQNAIQNIEEISLLDKLWNILKYCEKVSDLKVCFGQLFETVSDTTLRLQLCDDDENTAVGKMIKDIYAGRLTLHLSSKQSLELLIELGIQKMKKKYFSVIKSCGFLIGEQLQQKWNEIGSSINETKRRTFAELNIVKSRSQLRYLLCVHVLLEFLQLVEQNCCFSREVSLSVIKHAYNKYVVDKTSLELFTMMEKKQLCDLMVPLTFADVKLIQDCSPVKWQIKMTSAQKNSSVTTVFHYSKKPIFPDAIYQTYGADISSSAINEKFFVTRLESYTDSVAN